MHVDPRIVLEAKRNGIDNIYGQFTADPGHRVRANRVVDLLVSSTSPGAQPGARELLRRMRIGDWTVIANVHSNENDPTPRITVEVQRIRYHLRLDARGCVFDITLRNNAGEVVRLSGHSPFVRPGAIG